MKTLYIDFDETIVNSNKRIIELINNKYKINADESELKDYGYKSIYPITAEEKLEMFESEDFFNNLTFKKGFIDFYNEFRNKFKIVIVSQGTEKNLEKKEKWIRKNISSEINFIGINNKKEVDMKNGIQIDDNYGCLNTNAKIKVLFKDGNNYSWQQGYTNTNILVANTWEEIADIINFYSKYNYKTLKEL